MVTARTQVEIFRWLAEIGKHPSVCPTRSYPRLRMEDSEPHGLRFLAVPNFRGDALRV
jgi:hypothetical protein